MFSLARHLRNALQPLVHGALHLDADARQFWLDELRAECPTVAREMERMMPSSCESSPTFDPVATPCPIVRGSLEHLGLRC